jgi:hypothetical protein
MLSLFQESIGYLLIGVGWCRQSYYVEIEVRDEEAEAGRIEA